MATSDELKTLLLSGGADLVGFADLRRMSPDVRENMPFSISIGVALNPKIISQITKGPTKQYDREYERVNRLLDKLGHLATRFLEERRYNVKFYAATDNVSIDPDTLSTPLPHKTVATRAGLGWIGKCALLVTRDYGSAVRITSVLTELELPTGKPIDSSQCGDCNECVAICPGHASSGQNWYLGLPRNSFFDALVCRREAREIALTKIGIRKSLCGMCIAVCPWTQKYIAK